MLTFIKKIRQHLSSYLDTAGTFIWRRWTPKTIKNIPLIQKTKDFVRKENKSRKQRIILWGVIIGVVVVAWYSFSPKKTKQTFIQAKVQSGEVVSKISATGKITSKDQVKLTFGSSGIVDNIPVEVGGKVKKGELLASLDTIGLKAQIKQARGGLQAAKASLEKAVRGFDVQIAQQQLENAKTALDLSQNNLANTLKTTQQDITVSENQMKMSNQSLAATQDQLENLENTTSEDVIIASIQKEKAEEYRSNLEQVSKITKDSADSDMEIAREQEVKVKMQRQQTLDQQLSTLQDKSLQTDNSRLSYETAKIKAETSRDTAENQVVQNSGQVNLSQIQAQEKIVNKPSDIKSVQGQILQAEGSLEQAEHVLENSELYAPFSGTILSIATKENETYSSALGSFIEMANLDELQIEVDVSETDIMQVKEGQDVTLDFDGLPDEKFSGEVKSIDPGPEIVQGVVNYKVTITYEANTRIRLGMTANVEIITGQKDNALYVPIRAILLEDGKQYVRVKKGDSFEKREVKLGLQGDSTYQILEGVTEGEEILY